MTPIINCVANANNRSVKNWLNIRATQLLKKFLVESNIAQPMNIGAMIIIRAKISLHCRNTKKYKPIATTANNITTKYTPTTGRTKAISKTPPLLTEEKPL